MANYTGDFETITDPNDCRIWAFDICSIDGVYSHNIGNTMDSFIDECKKLDNPTIYFHNLKFDGEFIIYWLLNNGFSHVENRKDLESFTFTTLISNMGQFYSMEVCFGRRNKHVKKVTFIDSLKILNFSVEIVSNMFDLELKKGKIDYDAYREIGHELTEEETAYLKNDTEIMAQALNVLFTQGLTKMTQGSNALADYKQITGNKNFKKAFPIPQYDSDIRRAYKGGFTYLKPCYKDLDWQKE